MNTIYRDTNILWPQENIIARTMTIKLRNDSKKEVTHRKWNGQIYKQLLWSFTGSSIDMTLNDRHITIVCPVVQVSDPTILPFNSFALKPSREIFIDDIDSSSYEKADIYQMEPNSQYITPVNPRVEPAVDFSIFVSSCVGGVCSIKSKKGLPQHVANIVLADAISKNDVCPISNEPITRANASVTSCGHVFCKSSIDKWFAIKNECPVCKQVCS